MEQPLYKPLPFKHISKATNEAITYIDDRRSHKITPLKTRWEKFNRVCGGGLEYGCVYTIAGISASGKSAFVNTLETDLININPDQDIVVLSFSLEMLSYRQVGRKLSNKLYHTTSELYSANKDLDKKTFDKVLEASEEIKTYPIYYVDMSSNIISIGDTIKYFQEVVAKDKWLVVILDHTLMVQGDAERATLIGLQNLFINAKKIGKTTIIQVTQMNRNIESTDRINNPSGHYPMRSDLSSSDSIFQGSDVVAVIHRPETLNITAYGPRRLLVKNRVYMHFLKVREGEVGIIVFENALKYNDLKEIMVDDETQQTELKN